MATTTNLGLTKLASSDLAANFPTVENANLDKLDAQFTSGTFTPHLYDYETYLASLGTQTYIKVGKMYFFFINTHITNTYNISTMLQIRNFPCRYILGGNVYYAGTTGQLGDRTIQILDQPIALIRPNFTGSFGGGNAIFTAFLVGMGDYS